MAIKIHSIEEKRGMGDNSKNAEPHSSVSKAAARGETADVGGVAGARLSSFIERIERMDDEIKGLQDDRKDIFSEAKGVGFCTKTIRRIIKENKMDPEKVREADELFDLYKSALGKK